MHNIFVWLTINSVFFFNGLISNFPGKSFTEMEGVYSCFGVIYIGSCTDWPKREFGHVSCITAVDTGEPGQYEGAKRRHSHGCRQYCAGSSASNCSCIHRGHICDWRE